MHMHTNECSLQHSKSAFTITPEAMLGKWHKNTGVVLYKAPRWNCWQEQCFVQQGTSVPSKYFKLEMLPPFKFRIRNTDNIIVMIIVIMMIMLWLLLLLLLIIIIKICGKHTHDKPQISPNWFFSYMLMEFIVPPIGWAQHALVGRFPVPLSTYPPGFVMIGQRECELWPISSKPRPFWKYIGPWRPCFLTNLAHL